MGAATANGQMDPGGAGARKGEPKEQKPGLRSICRRGLVKQIRQGGKGRTEGERPGEISTNGKGRGSLWYKIGKLMVYSNEQLSTQLEYNVLFFYSALCQ